MRFDPPLTRGRLVRRYQRYLADVRLDDGTEVTAHCPNPGRMTGVSRPGARVYLSRARNPHRKLAWTLEAVRVGRSWVGVHPALANALVREALDEHSLPPFAAYAVTRAEVSPAPGSRFDFLLEAPGSPPLWLEVKYATLRAGRVGLFPDAVSRRGQKHLRELAARRRCGDGAALLLVCPRSDVDAVGPADGVDPVYGELLREVAREGVAVHAVRARVGRRGAALTEMLPVDLGPHLWDGDGIAC